METAGERRRCGNVSRTPASILILLAVLVLLLWLAPEVPLLGFAGVLIAVALRAAALPIAARTSLGEAGSVLLVCVVVAGLIAIAGWAAVDPLTAQVKQLATELPRSLDALRTRLQDLPGGERLLGQVQSEQVVSTATGAVASAATGTLGVMGNVLVVVLVGIYLAVRPEGYLAGLTALIAPDARAATRETLEECTQVLRGFLLGQGFAMVVSGTATWIGLWLVGLNLAGVLAVITAVLGFMPVIGPVIAAVPAVLLALAQDPWMALQVIAVFVVVQNIEGNILTPMVQDRAANIPPALLLLAQSLMGALFGLLGLALAAPALCVAQVVVRRGYVQGWLEQRPS